MFFRRAEIDMTAPLPVEVAEAIALQERLRHEVHIGDDFTQPCLIAGVDVGYDLRRDLTRAVVVTLDWQSLELQESAVAFLATRFPYVPGLLSFREIPAILEALSCLGTPPDLLMVDGQGIAHPRRLGIAAHLGVVTGLPAIGVAKSRLCGRHTDPGPRKGDTAPLTDKGAMIGTVLRSKERCNPLYISAGHRVSQETALAITIRCLGAYRLPMPTHLADKISKWEMGKLEKTAYGETGTLDLWGE